MPGTKQQKILSSEERSIINTLLYFDIFDHPLTFRELCYATSRNGKSEQAFANHLKKLTSRNLIQCQQGYYFLNGKYWSALQRIKEIPKVSRYYKIGRFMGRLIASFPYTRGVFVSGSLSKDRIAKDGDIDFFIVTTPGRLWVARTLLMVFKKLFLFNSYKYFCLNYFVDEKSLLINDRDLYTATEIATLVPLYNQQVYQEFMKANQWIGEYYPNFPPRDSGQTIKSPVGIIKRIMEYVLNGNTGDKLDDWLMHKTLHYRQKKYATLSQAEFDKAFITRKNASKHHPNDFRWFVLEHYRKRQDDFEQKYDVFLSEDVEGANHHICYDSKGVTG